MHPTRTRTLTQLFREHFEPTVAARGDHAYLSGHLDILEATDFQVSAKVRCNSHSHEATLLVDSDVDLICCCDCGYLSSGDAPCQHAWALLREAERRGLLQPLISATDPSVYTSTNVNDFDPYEPATPSRADRRRVRSAPPPPDWKSELNRLRLTAARRPNNEPRAAESREIVYVLDFERGRGPRAEYLSLLDDYGDTEPLEVKVYARNNSPDNTTYSPLTWSPDNIHKEAREEDRAALALLSTFTNATYPPAYRNLYGSGPDVQVPPAAAANILRLLLSTGRCGIAGRKGLRLFSWKPSQDLVLRLDITAEGDGYLMAGRLAGEGETQPLPSPNLVLRGGVIFDTESLEARPLKRGSNEAWYKALQSSTPLSIPREQGLDFLAEILTADDLPPIDLPEELQYTEEHPEPHPRLHLRQARPDEESSRIYADLNFGYGRVIFPGRGSNKTAFAREPPPALIHRNPEAERGPFDRLQALGFKPAPRRSGDSAFTIATRKFPAAAQTLIAEGWHLESDGKLYRTPTDVRVTVTSSVDWFDVSGTVAFGEGHAPVKLPALLRAAQRGERVVQLGDGTVGLLTDEWLRRYGLLADMASGEADGPLKFRINQVGVLDALLAAKEGVSYDESFKRARARLKEFNRIKPVSAPASFKGRLRPYQREGLGWLLFLQQFGFGGCLADDMGLGKTPTTLALLERRRNELNAAGKSAHPPSIVIATKTAVHNWRKEAERFTPGMRLHVHTGSDRLKPREFANYDLILTSYGTVRQDAVDLKDFEFDYVIADEAQFIKNASTQAAKAVRLLRARNALALTGTPVENHLSDLWSIFEFVNPGMLGRSKIFDRAAKVEPDADDLHALSQALRPFILRRLKTQKNIARTLPPKTEQILHCELPPHQRKRYDELRDYYRASILRTMDEQGLNRSKIHVLAALTRLRQAACHLGLIDEKKTVQTCGKFDVLFETIEGLSGDGHKCLVFSQFKSFLKILAARLDRAGTPYCYMDGDTSERERERVEDVFNTDPAKKLFLITLKTGGTALNLQAADYVFILDPWWNPKPEAQAIDRAHRDGQSRHVFAYKLIARDTIEEKVLELQEKKTALGDAIITSENGFISKMTRKEIELLFA